MFHLTFTCVLLFCTIEWHYVRLGLLNFILQNQLDPRWTQTLRKGETQTGGGEQEEATSNLGQQSGR